MNIEQQQALNDAVEEARPLVRAIESRVQLTKDHYGEYLPLVKSQLHALVFIKAGANKQGVLTAMRLNGIEL